MSTREQVFTQLRAHALRHPMHGGLGGVLTAGHFAKLPLGVTVALSANY